ncbi:hypothetical protein [Leptolyngbya sp. BC1307]|uniref:hypothetical protein n=1 Tax=Leptolyngbya sp. BC1307 TaxID=2029589 RepID=UPI000EFC0B1C|nr:hypothetical protein [Leptolyngbya sp. BC1307]
MLCRNCLDELLEAIAQVAEAKLIYRQELNCQTRQGEHRTVLVSMATSNAERLFRLADDISIREYF